jgi:hypothetical protein
MSLFRRMFGSEPESPPVETVPPKSESRLYAERMMAISARYVCSGITPNCVQVMAFGELNATCNACGTPFRKTVRRWA